MDHRLLLSFIFVVNCHYICFLFSYITISYYYHILSSSDSFKTSNQEYSDPVPQKPYLFSYSLHNSPSTSDFNSDPLRPFSWQRYKSISVNFHIAYSRLEQFQHALISFHSDITVWSSGSKAAEYSKQAKVYLSVCEIDPQTLSAALGKAHEEAIQPRIFDPALGTEGVRIGEDGRVFVHEQGCHAHRNSGRNDPFLVRCSVPEDHFLVG